ncbi:MAG: flagellar M-ring protein FliF [Oscillospiraceae bacterium]|nr:flagellar M-ring protein FliF [Oscillospiraceae bacterium]MBR6677330.1 flagellar M-ring protein FliF [Oscillospiraceae bacterium]
MSEKLKGYWEKAKGLLQKVSKKVYIALAVLLVAALAFVIYLNSRPYEVLFADLSASEMTSILSYLEENGITKYQVEDSDTILVPREQEAALKAKLVQQGYGLSGFAYTSSSATGILSTESERKASQLKDLEGKLSAVVRSFDGVKDAVVNINPGDDQDYVLDFSATMEATAAVVLEMKDGATLKTEQAQAIRDLVAHSVKGLSIDYVSITDTYGNTYSAAGDDVDVDSSALKMRLEEEQENKIRTEVLQVLIPWYGRDNVKVAVNCTVDVSQVVEDSTEVYLPEWADDGSTNGRGIVGSRVYNYVYVRDGEETEGGVVGSTTNADIPEYVEDLPELNGTEDEVQLSGQTDYDNSRSEKHIIRTAGYLTDCSISVSINSTTAGVVDVNAVRTHVARAAGITGSVDETTGQEYLGDKVSVIAQPFYDPDANEPIPGSSVEMWMIYAAAGGLLLFLLILVLILVLRRKKKKKRAEEEAQRQAEFDMAEFLKAAADSQMANSNGAGADVMNIQSERSIELRHDIRKFAEDNPEIAAQMLRTWLRGDDDDA